MTTRDEWTSSAHNDASIVWSFVLYLRAIWSFKGHELDVDKRFCHNDLARTLIMMMPTPGWVIAMFLNTHTKKHRAAYMTTAARPTQIQKLSVFLYCLDDVAFAASCWCCFWMSIVKNAYIYDPIFGWRVDPLQRDRAQVKAPRSVPRIYALWLSGDLFVGGGNVVQRMCEEVRACHEWDLPISLK